MKQIPRYDPANVDPLSIKAALSQLYNNTITDMWMNSKFKNKISIGCHNIDCTGAIKEARYRETKTGKYDGIHLFGSSGRKTYTLSVLNILKCSELTSSDYDYHQTCAQYRYQARQSGHRQAGHRRTDDRRAQDSNTQKQKQGYSVPTENRFDTLSGINMGNC